MSDEAATVARCRHCGEPIHLLTGHCKHWIHDHGFWRCLRDAPRYPRISDRLAEPAVSPGPSSSTL